MFHLTSLSLSYLARILERRRPAGAGRLFRRRRAAPRDGSRLRRTPARPICPPALHVARTHQRGEETVMNRTLGLVAVSGLSIGASACRSPGQSAAATRSMIAEDRFGWRSCDDDTVAVAGNERRLPWTGGDTIEISDLAVPLHLVAGDGGEFVMRAARPTRSRAFAVARWQGLFSCGRLGAGLVDIELLLRARHAHPARARSPWRSSTSASLASPSAAAATIQARRARSSACRPRSPCQATSGWPMSR